MLSNQDDGIDELVREMRGRVRGIRKRRHENVKSRLSLVPDFRIKRVRKRLPETVEVGMIIANDVPTAKCIKYC